MIQRDTNKVYLKGTVTNISDGTTGKGLKAVNFDLATTRKEFTDMVPCSAYSEYAEEFLAKFSNGDRVVLIGRLVVKEKENKKLIKVVLEECDLISNDKRR